MLRKKKRYFKWLIKPKDYKTDTQIKITVKILDKGFVENLRMMVYQFDQVVKQVDLYYVGKAKNKNTRQMYSVYEAEFSMQKSGVYWFYFVLLIEGEQYYVLQNEKFLLRHKNQYVNECGWKLYVRDENLVENHYWTGRTIYQLMPDRFCIGQRGIIPVKGRYLKKWQDRTPEWKPDEDGIYRNEYFYGGNLQGIREKIPYLKELGFDVIYMTPICKSRTYHHYDTEDYFRIDEMIGADIDYQELCKTAHQYDISIISDMVFNHSSDRHLYFQSARKNIKSHYRAYYCWDENGEPITWYGFKDMPEFNKLNHEFQELARAVVKKYLENGMDAVRLDLGENLPKEFLKYIGTLREKYPNLIFISEMWSIATNKQNPQITDGQVDSLMNYPITDAILRWVRTGNHEHFQYRYNKVYGEYPKVVADRLMNILSSHDTPTAITMLVGKGMNEDPYTGGDIWDIEAPWRHHNWFDTFGFRKFEADHDQISEEDYEVGEKLLKIAIAILYTSPGNPCLFMGTENAESGYKDPFCRKPMNWEEPNKAMQEFVKAIGKYRQQQKSVLAEGETRIRQCTRDMLVIERYVGHTSLILLVNRTGKVYKPQVSKEYKIVFSENSTKDEIGKYGILIVKRER